MIKYIIPDENWKQAVLAEAMRIIDAATIVEPSFNLTVKTEVALPEGVEAPTISIMPKASVKMWALLNSNDSKEIGWHGLVTRDGNKFVINDIMMYPQTTTAATVTTDDALYSQWINGLDDETFYALRFHGHSHVRMGCSPSATDITYQRQLIKDIKDYYIFGIFNLRREFTLFLYDIEHNLMFETDDIKFEDYTLAGFGWAKKEMEQHLHTVVTTTYTGTSTAAATAKAETAQTPRHSSTYDQIKRETSPGLYGRTDYKAEDFWKEYYEGKGIYFED